MRKTVGYRSFTHIGWINGRQSSTMITRTLPFTVKAQHWFNFLKWMYRVWRDINHMLTAEISVPWHLVWLGHCRPKCLYCVVLCSMFHSPLKSVQAWLLNYKIIVLLWTRNCFAMALKWLYDLTGSFQGVQNSTWWSIACICKCLYVLCLLHQAQAIGEIM